MELEYDTFGLPADPALLLIMGLTAQMTAWDERLCQMWADAGRFVIRFDNRDCGLSTKLDGQVPDLAGAMMAAFADQPPPPLPYTLTDMAADAIGLLDHLNIEKAHVIGASLGGMIAQVVAVNYPDRVLTLTSIMSQPGDPEAGQPTPEAALAIFSPPPTMRDESPSGGFLTADVIPGAHLLYLADMGHDFPEELWPSIVNAIITHTSLSRTALSNR